MEFQDMKFQDCKIRNPQFKTRIIKYALKVTKSIKHDHIIICVDALNMNKHAKYNFLPNFKTELSSP